MKKSVIFPVIVVVVIIITLIISFFGFKQFNKSNEENNKELEIENVKVVEDEVIESPSGIEEIEEELSFEEKVWNQRIDNALAETNCPIVSGKKYGELYYEGPLIDTHYHIANIPDYSPEELEPDYTDEEMPILGVNIKISDIVCTLKQENTKKIFAFFPIYPEIPEQMIEVAKRTMEKYPEYFVPFIMSPDNDNSPNGFPTVDAETLKKMLNGYSRLFQGYGEIGLYARENGAKELPPDSERLQKIYPIIRENKLAVYFHLGEGQKESFEKVLKANPDINFIFHGDQLIQYQNGKQNLEDIEEIISNHPNVFYTIDELYGDEWLIRPDITEEEFLMHLENYETLLEEDLSTWKKIIEKYPDQFMWGTDRSDQVLWSHEPEIGQALANYARAFIARLGPEVQEKFAYKNAEKILS